MTEGMVDRWRAWLMPRVQPFVVDQDEAEALRSIAHSRVLSDELRDTFRLYAIPDHHHIVWLDRAGSASLSPETVRTQPTRHLWPTRSTPYDRRRTTSWVARSIHPVDHSPPPEGVWRRAADVLPDARRLAGRFPLTSGPNCFATVMAAAGVPDAEGTWMQREPFEDWLADHTIAGGNDSLPGTVLVWRDRGGSVGHAGVTLGDGHYLHKPSQGWMTPALVLPVRDGIIAARTPGQHLERHTIR